MSKLPNTTPPNHPVRQDRGRVTKSRQYQRSPGLLTMTLGVCLAFALGGCSTAKPSPAASDSGSAQATSSTPSATPESTSSATGAPGSETQAPASTAPANSPSAAPVTALCKAADLAGSLDGSGGGAAGHVYFKLMVSNKSAVNCILDGYSGVSMVNASAQTPIGAPADRDPSAPSMGPITLAPGQKATAVLRYTQAANYQDCQRVQADSIMVYPPSATDRLVIAQPLTACSNPGINLLTIGAFQK